MTLEVIIVLGNEAAASAIVVGMVVGLPPLSPFSLLFDSCGQVTPPPRPPRLAGAALVFSNGRTCRIGQNKRTLGLFTLS